MKTETLLNVAGLAVLGVIALKIFTQPAGQTTNATKPAGPGGMFNLPAFLNLGGASNTRRPAGDEIYTGPIQTQPLFYPQFEPNAPGWTYRQDGTSTDPNGYEFINGNPMYPGW